MSKETTTSNKPAFSLRDGAIKLTCWANKSDDKIFHSIDVVRSYTDDKGDWHDTNQLSGSDILKASSLMQEGYAKIRELRSQAQG